DPTAAPEPGLAAPPRLRSPAGATLADQPGEAIRHELLPGGRPWPRLRAMHALLVAPAELRANRIAAKERVDGVGHVAVDEHAFAVLDLDDHVERGRRLSLEHALLRAPAARFLVAEGDALDAADEVGQRRVEHQVVERVAQRGADEAPRAVC